MKSQRLHKFILFLGIGILTSCLDNVSPNEETGPEYFTPALSSTLGQNDFPQLERNPMSTEGVILGKTLFYDKALSQNGKVSCASCHDPSMAFTDGLGLSNQGVSGTPLHRHAPPLFNLAWHKGLFWDGGSVNLESLVFGPLTHPDEMGADLNEVLHYLRGSSTYPVLFEAAFKSDSITSALVGRSLAQFTRNLISQDSKYDQWKRNEIELDDPEIQGYQVYQKNCSSCHTEGLFTDLSYHNNGLDASYPNPTELEGIYLGRYRISFEEKDRGAYKTPSLRNIAVTAPYMHDGRFNTLDEVLEHYDHGVQVNESLAPQLTDGIQLSEKERTDLLAFLNTLTDYEFIHNKAYQE